VKAISVDFDDQPPVAPEEVDDVSTELDVDLGRLEPGLADQLEEAFFRLGPRERGSVVALEEVAHPWRAMAALGEWGSSEGFRESPACRVHRVFGSGVFGDRAGSGRIA
jgi:hypothetical protein